MNRKSIEYVLTKMGVDSIKQNGEWLMLSCPLAPWTHAGGTDRRPSFGVRESTGVSGVHCFSCGFKGGMLSLVREYGKYAIEAGLWSTELMQEMIDFVILAEDEDEYDVEEHIVPPEVVTVPVKLESYLNIGHEYFEKRGITEETIKEWNLGFVESYMDKDAGIYMYNRVLFPIYAKDGLHEQLVGIIGRSTDGEEPKYKNAPPNFRKSNYVYGGWLAKDRRKIIVVEGPVDCLIVNQNLKKHKMEDLFAVALLGADPSERQIDWLKDNADEVICMLDNDPSGKLGTKKLIEALDSHVVVSVVKWDDRYKDPDEAGDYVITMLNCRETVLEHRLSRILRL